MTDQLLWIVQATAVAGVRCGFPDGERHALLGFVLDADRDFAHDRLRGEVEAKGWRDVVVTRSGNVPSDLSTVKKADLHAAATQALELGCSLIFYEEPLTEHDGIAAN